MRIITSDMMLDLPYERAVIHAEPYEPGQDEETEMVKVFARVDGTDFYLATYPEKKMARDPRKHQACRDVPETVLLHARKLNKEQKTGHRKTYAPLF